MRSYPTNIRGNRVEYSTGEVFTRKGYCADAAQGEVCHGPTSTEQVRAAGKVCPSEIATDVARSGVVKGGRSRNNGAGTPKAYRGNTKVVAVWPRQFPKKVFVKGDVFTLDGKEKYEVHLVRGRDAYRSVRKWWQNMGGRIDGVPYGVPGWDWVPVVGGWECTVTVKVFDDAHPPRCLTVRDRQDARAGSYRNHHHISAKPRGKRRTTRRKSELNPRKRGVGLGKLITRNED